MQRFSVLVLLFVLAVSSEYAAAAGKFFPRPDVGPPKTGASNGIFGKPTPRMRPDDVVELRSKSSFVTGVAMQPIKPLITIGVAGSLVYYLARRFAADQWIATKFKTLFPPSNRSKQAVQQVYEELAMSIRGLQDAQRDAEAAAQRLQDELHDLKQTMFARLTETRSTADNLTVRVTKAEETNEELAGLLRMDRHDSLSALEGSLTQLEDRVEQEGRALAASVEQLREEVPQQLSKHDALISRKLEKFKQDLRELIGRVTAAATTRVDKNKKKH
jgi:gas vesicle protein